jgi:hypothetical protein
MVLVFMRLFSHLGSKFGANANFMSHFEQICFFAQKGEVAKWEDTTKLRLISGVMGETYEIQPL